MIRSRCIVFVEARIVVVDYDAVDDTPKSPDHVTSSPSSTHQRSNLALKMSELVKVNGTAVFSIPSL